MKLGRGYSISDLWNDISTTRTKFQLDKTERKIWGTDPLDLGEGLAFSYSGEQLFSPGKLERNISFRDANIERELAMINYVIEKNINSLFE